MDFTDLNFTETMRPYCSGNIILPDELAELFMGQEFMQFILGVSSVGLSESLIVFPAVIEKAELFSPDIEKDVFNLGIHLNSNIFNFIKSHVENEVENASMMTACAGSISWFPEGHPFENLRIFFEKTEIDLVRSGSNYDISIKSEIEIKPKGSEDVELIETTKLDKELIISLRVDVKTLKYAFGYNEIYVDDRVKSKSIASDINSLDLRNVALFRNVNTVLGYCKTGYGVQVTRVNLDGKSMWLAPFILEDTLPQPFEVYQKQFQVVLYGISLAAIVDKMDWQFATHLQCESTTANLGRRVVGHRCYETDGLNKNYPDLGIRRYVINASLNANGLELDWCARVTNLRKDKQGKWEPGEISGEFCIPWEPLLLSRTVGFRHLLKMRERLASGEA